MKSTMTKSRVERSSLPVHFDIPMALLLVAASALAIAGGAATATLFFGILLIFALLLFMSRPGRSSAQRKGQILTP